MYRLAPVLFYLISANAEAQAGVGEIKWSYKAEERVGSPAIGSDYTIYFTTNRYVLSSPGFKGSLYALDPDGTLKWYVDMNDYESVQKAFPTKGVELSTPVLGTDGTVYLCLMSRITGYSYGYALAMNHLTGEREWRKELASRKDDIAWERDSRSPAIGPDETFYFFTSVGLSKEWDYLHSVNSDSTLNWSVNTNMGPSPVIGADGTIYYGYMSYLYALNPDGTEKWRELVGGNTMSGLAIGSDGTVYFGGEDSCLYAVNPLDGSVSWIAKTDGAVVGSPVIGFDEVVYVTARDSALSSLHAFEQGGEEKWRYQIEGMMTDPAFAANGFLYVGLCGSESVPSLCEIDAGDLNWKCMLEDDSAEYVSTPVIGPNGTVYAGTNDYLYAVQGSAPLANSSWPMDRHDLSRTAWINGSGVEGVAEEPDHGSSYGSGIRIKICVVLDRLRVDYILPQGQEGTIDVYNPLGQRVSEISVLSRGSVELDLSVGVYLIVLRSNGKAISSKAVVVQ
ncbi:PQQ-binding-like beta-propeller repeat protein [candidate division WOR-3 bacterium]|nr:PQQ-binding-like beta-propeller repeat protein [candidate division WOR-3 bacterium]